MRLFEKDVRPPEPLDDVGSGDQLIPPFHKQDQQIHGQSLELYRLTALAQFVGRNVERELAELQRARREALEHGRGGVYHKPNFYKYLGA